MKSRRCEYKGRIDERNHAVHVVESGDDGIHFMIGATVPLTAGTIVIVLFRTSVMYVKNYWAVKSDITDALKVAIAPVMTLTINLLRSSTTETTRQVTVATTGRHSTPPVSSETTGKVDIDAPPTREHRGHLEPRPRAAREIAINSVLTSTLRLWENIL